MPEWNDEQPRTLSKEQTQKAYDLLKGPFLAPELAAYVQAYEALKTKLDELLPNPHRIPGEDWMDDEHDEAIARYRFWWTWGN